jgi:hypothetical protein
MIDEKRFKLIDSKTGKEYEFDGLKGSVGPGCYKYFISL